MQHQWGATYVSKQNMEPYSSTRHVALIPNEAHKKSKFWFPLPYTSIPRMEVHSGQTHNHLNVMIVQDICRAHNHFQNANTECIWILLFILTLVATCIIGFPLRTINILLGLSPYPFPTLHNLPLDYHLRRYSDAQLYSHHMVFIIVMLCVSTDKCNYCF